MSIIDETYLKHSPVFIDGLDSSNGFDPDITAPKVVAVRRAIEIYEAELLEMILGEEAYAEYVSTKADEKWNTFKEKLANSTTKISPIANYVFYYFRKDNAVKTADTSDYVRKYGNDASMVGIEENNVVVWNKMCKLLYKFFIWLEDNETSLGLTSVIDKCNWDRLTTTKNVFGI